MASNQKIYSATYSNVPVYEFNPSPGNHVMRRKADNWINATHILKVAAYDKPSRTRILEREVQKGIHEKVQGGYGKYQGTWIPLHDGRGLAERNGVLEKLLPIFDFVPGDRSPPPAPKHATAASTRPRAPRQTAPIRREVHPMEIDRDQYHDAEPDGDTIMSDSIMEDDGGFNSRYTNPRKRKRTCDDMLSVQDQQHRIWADTLLDYFMLLESDDPIGPPNAPPPGISLDKPIDDKGNTALHWAAAMGAIDIVKDLISSGARIDAVSNNLETPFMRAVLFTNNFDKKTMPKLARILAPAVRKTDWFGSTVFHHIAATTSSKNKYQCARYYFDSIINILLETWIPSEVSDLLNKRDKNGDTAIHICASNGARKCVRALLGRNVAVNIPNNHGVTADDLIVQLNERRQSHYAPQRARELSSSPFVPDGRPVNGDTASLPSYPVRMPERQYHCATASAVMARIIPALLEKYRVLAEEYETQYEKTEQESLEVDRVVRKRQAEIESLARLAEGQDLERVEREVLDITLVATDDMEERELRALMVEAEGLMEMESGEELGSLAGANGVVNGSPGVGNGSQPGSMGPPATMSNGVRDVGFLTEKMGLSQRERQRLVRDSVRSMSVAGLGEKQAEYKRLLRAALGVKEEEVENMLGDILRELEEEVARTRLESV